MAGSVSMQVMVREARRQRKAQRNISTLLLPVIIGLVFVLGGVFIIVLWGGSAWVIAAPFMVAGIVTAVRLGSKYRPRRPWGIGLFDRCPKCHQQNLREDMVTYEVPGAVRKTIYRAMVVLCDEACGFGAGFAPGTRRDLDAFQAPGQ